MNFRSFGLKLLTRREHSVKEFTTNLHKKFPENSEEIDQMVAEFIEKNWISDERFTESLIHDTLLTTKSGPQKIIQKLEQKGIDRELSLRCIEEFYPAQKQLEIAQDLAQKKRAEIERRGKTKNDLEIQQKIMAFLVGKGFGFETAREAGNVLLR